MDTLKAVRLALRFLPLALWTLSAAAPVSVHDVYNGTLDLHTQIETFRHIDKLFPSRTVAHGSSYPLPAAPAAQVQQLAKMSFLSGGRTVTLEQYLKVNRVTSVLVLKDGKIALQTHRLGNNERTRWVSWSIVKSITSTLLGAAIKDGLVGSLDDPVTKYVPRLVRSAYDGVTVRQLAQMASGVRWSEAYTDPRSDRRRMLELQIQQRPGAILDFMRTLPRAATPGTRWNYSTGESHVLGAVVRAAVKRPLSTYLSEKIWRPFGMESDATWWIESPDGLEVGGSGFSATLRDYGRFGQFVLNGGKAGGHQVTPAGWFPDAGMPKTVGGRSIDYGYMWWSFGAYEDAAHHGAFEALGIFGQHLYVNPRHKVVIVVWSARAKPSGSTVIDDRDFFAGVVEALAQ